MAVTINDINAVSHQYFADLVQQQVYEKTIVLNILRDKHRISFSGGTKLHVPVRYKALGQAKMIDPDDARITVTEETRTAIELDWKWSVCDIGMTWREIVFNGSDGRIADLLADKALEGGQDLSKKISDQFTQLYASKGALDMDGFYSCVRGAATSYGGISDTDAPLWTPGLNDTTTATLALYGTGSLDAGLRACHFETFPDLMLTTLALASIYASKLQPGERREPEDGKAGATDLYFRKVPIIADTHILPEHWLFLNTEHMGFYLHKDSPFDVGKWVDDPDHYKALRALLTCVGNFAFKCRRAFGAYTNLSS